MTLVNYVLLMMTFQMVPYLSEGKPSEKRLILSPSCAAKGYCLEKHADYPQKLVDRMLQNLNLTVMQEKPSNSSEKQQRPARNIMSESESDCEKEEQEVLVYEIIDVNDNVRIVVQSEHFKQVLNLEQCLHPGRMTKETQHFNQEVIDEYNLQCVQHFIDISLVVLNMKWTNIELVKSKHGFPVSCDCRILEEN